MLGPKRGRDEEFDFDASSDDSDHGTPPEMAQQIHANLRGSKLVTIPAAAHLSNIEQPKAFNDAVVPFLEARRAA